MSKIINRSIVCLAISGFMLSATAMADDGKEYVGGQCGFANNPLASHNRISHGFRNTSGVSQWITCPIVRETANNIEYAAIEFNATVSNVRLEIRYDDAGSLAGWNYYGTSNLGGGAVEYFWFDGSTTGTASSGAVLAIEAYIPNNAYVYKYNLTENT
jgi:hypothetical protein